MNASVDGMEEQPPPNARIDLEALVQKAREKDRLARARDLSKPIRLLRRGVRVAAILKELEAHPELWNANVFRKTGYGNAHQDIDDIIVRYRDWAEWTGDRAAFNAEHEAVWWEAADSLPSVKSLAYDLMRHFQGDRLGMVLITRIPPGKSVGRHHDVGWHAEHFAKIAVSLAANERQAFCFDGHELRTVTGDLFVFDNARDHWVTNESDEPRITLITCIRPSGPTIRNCRWDGR